MSVRKILSEVFSPVLRVQIDLGSSSVRIAVEGKIVADEPGVVYIGKDEKHNCFGHEAKSLVDRLPVIRPIEAARVHNFESAVLLIEALLEKHMPKYRRKHRLQVIVGVSCDCMAETKMAIKEVIRKLKTKRFTIIDGSNESYPVKPEDDVVCLEQGIASLFGAGLPVTGSKAVAVIESGGGTTEAVIAVRGVIVAKRSVPVAGIEEDKAIQSWLAKERYIMIGLDTAEKAKIALSSGEAEYKLHGRSVNGDPKKDSYIMTRDDLKESCKGCFEEISSMLIDLLKDPGVTPEILGDLKEETSEARVLISGGASEILGFEDMVAKVTNFRCTPANNRRQTVIFGCAVAQGVPLEVIVAEAERLTIEREGKDSEGELSPAPVA